MRKLDAIQAMLLAATASGALANIDKHEAGKDYSIDLDLTGCTIDTSDTGENQERTGTLTVDAPQAWQLIDFLTTGRATIEKIEPHKEGEEE